MHLTLNYLTFKATPDQRSEYVARLDADIEATHRVSRPRRFKLKPAGPDGRGG